MIPFLGDYSRSLILADLERELGVKHQTAKRYADMLVKNRILTEERKPKNLIYGINKGNTLVMSFISGAESIVRDDALRRSILLKRLYEMLSPYMMEAGFLVFGSSASGRVGEDIDLLVALDTTSNTNLAGLRDSISRFEKTYGKKVHAVEVNNFGASAALIREIIKKHVIFNRFDAFTSWFWEFTWKK